MAGKGSLGPPRLPTLLLVVSLVLSYTTNIVPISAGTDADALLQFKSTLSDNGGEVALRSWNPGSEPCAENRSSWRGILCFSGKVWGLQVENMGLSGNLNIVPLANLQSLRAISFMNNNFVGPMPDITKLGALKALYLSNNQFRGEIPDGIFNATRSLKKVYMSNNEFSGKIPSSVTQLPKLLVLRLDSNEFQGGIPDFEQPGLRFVNVSFNKLEGRIPDSLSMMDQSLFAGNAKLCGQPLEAKCPLEPPPSHKMSASTIAIIVIAIVAAVAILCCIFLFFKRRQSSNDLSETTTAAAATSAAKHMDALDVEKLEQGCSNQTNGGHGAAAAAAAGKKASKEAERLTFIKEGSERFELQDLLKASAEVLGSGNFGSSYKAVLINGPSVVVKRYKEMSKVGREDFQEHMRRLGRLSHPNLLPLVAYYYRREEKLFITNNILNGSLAHMLHGNAAGCTPLEWPARLKLIKGITRGLAYLYEELSMLTLPHGHLKSSNVLIDDNSEALLTDYTLVPVVNPSHASQVMVAYKSPEASQTGKPSKKSDVWSLGILILEILTGKFPATNLEKSKGDVDLAGWVNSVVKLEEWTDEVFDSEMKGWAKNAQGQMLKLLQIGLACCEADVDKRLEMKEVLDKIEEVKETEESDENDPSMVMSNVDLFSSKDDMSFAAEN